MKKQNRKPGKTFLAMLWAFFLVFVWAGQSWAEVDSWPVEIKSDKGLIMIYQPQLESLKGDKLSGRAAVSVKTKGSGSPIFGAVWLKARTVTDRSTRMVELRNVKITRVRFLEAESKKEKALAALIEKALSRQSLKMSLDRMLASLDVAKKERQQAKNLKNQPPQIIFSQTPKVLVVLDGKPEMSRVEGGSLMRVVNTPFLIALDMKSGAYYLDGGEIWYRAGDVMGPWSVAQSMPPEVIALRQKMAAHETKEAAPKKTGQAQAKVIPSILVATEPTELIVTDGKPKFTPIQGGELLYMSNTTSDVLLEVRSQKYYVLLSGRWFRSKSLGGPWVYAAADKLPESFAKIPPTSEMSRILSFVAGTQEAREAVLDANIPQTATVDRKTAKLTVTYDGPPKFVVIENTNMLYAVNTPFAVINYMGRYYACHQGVWFVSYDPLGPWVAADSIPSVIYTIPPSCPIYNVRYVYIYDSTPEVIYVGYTSGYVCSYVYGPTVVYGTGWYYPGWYRAYYYPRPWTWGFHVRYNPWYGWGYGFSYYTGGFVFSFGYGGWSRWGWWGPAGWRGYHRGWRRGYYRGYRAGYRHGRRYHYHHGNIYRRHPRMWTKPHGPMPGPGPRPGPAFKPGPRMKAAPSMKPGKAVAPAMKRAGRHPNNLYVDQKGNVFRRSGRNWEQRQKNNWKQVRPAQTPGRGFGKPPSQPQVRPRMQQGQPQARPRMQQGQPQARPRMQQSQPRARPRMQQSPQSGPSGGRMSLENEHRARQRGASRTQTYQRSGPGSFGGRSPSGRGPGSFGGGGGRGSGGGSMRQMR